VFSGIFKYGMRVGWVRGNPLKRVEWPRILAKQDDPATYLSFNELEKILAVSGQGGQNL
jgi:hypothetical protein